MMSAELSATDPAQIECVGMSGPSSVLHLWRALNQPGTPASTFAFSICDFVETSPF